MSRVHSDAVSIEEYKIKFPIPKDGVIYLSLSVINRLYDFTRFTEEGATISEYISLFEYLRTVPIFQDFIARPLKKDKEDIEAITDLIEHSEDFKSMRSLMTTLKIDINYGVVDSSIRYSFGLDLIDCISIENLKDFFDAFPELIIKNVSSLRSCFHGEADDKISTEAFSAMREWGMTPAPDTEEYRRLLDKSGVMILKRKLSQDFCKTTPLLLETCRAKGSNIIEDAHVEQLLEKAVGALGMYNTYYPELVEYLVKNGVNINAIIGRGTILHNIIIQAGSPHTNLDEAIKSLLGLGADPNIRTPINALHIAISSGNIEVVKILLRAGADATVKDQYGLTPLLLAIHFGYEDIALTILDYPNDINYQLPNNITAFNLAIYKNMHLLQQKLLEHVDINFDSYYGFLDLFESRSKVEGIVAGAELSNPEFSAAVKDIEFQRSSTYRLFGSLSMNDILSFNLMSAEQAKTIFFRLKDFNFSGFDLSNIDPVILYNYGCVAQKFNKDSSISVLKLSSRKGYLPAALKLIDIGLSEIHIHGYKLVLKYVEDAITNGAENSIKFEIIKAIGRYEKDIGHPYTKDPSIVIGHLQVFASKGSAMDRIDGNMLKRFAESVKILKKLSDISDMIQVDTIKRICESFDLLEKLQNSVKATLISLDDVFNKISKVQTKKEKSKPHIIAEIYKECESLTQLGKELLEAERRHIIVDDMGAFKKKIITLNKILERAELLTLDIPGITDVASTMAKSISAYISSSVIPETFNGICDSENLRIYAQHYKKNPNHAFCKSVQEAIHYRQVAISRNSKESAARKLNKELKLLDESVYSKNEQVLAIKFAKNQGVSSHFIIKYLKESTEPLHKEIVAAIAANTDMSTAYTADTKGTSLDGAFAMKIANEGDDEENLPEEDRGLGDLSELPSFEENDDEEDAGDNVSETSAVAAAGGVGTIDLPETLSSDNLAFLRQLFNTQLQTVTGIEIDQVKSLISELGEENFKVTDTSLGFKIKNNITREMITTHRPHTDGFSGGYLDIKFIKKFIKMLERVGVDRHFSVGRFEEDIDVEHEDAELLEHTDDPEKDWQEDLEHGGIDSIIEEHVDDLQTLAGMSSPTLDA